MAKLKKNLTLFDVFAISTGAMFSSGLFLLPGLAAAQTGASVFLAYGVAGMMIIPAMLSQAELSTAMPRAGGTYFFLDRAMGPLVGTIGGLGTWVALVFKCAFALIGMGAYLSLYVEAPIVTVALSLTALFCIVNLVGAKETSVLQRFLVTVLLIVVFGFVLIAGGQMAAGSVTIYDDKEFWTSGVDGFFATVGFVFVSYAGLTKVASVAEEVQRPDKNIPMGMFLSLVVATIAYTSAVGVITYLLPVKDFHLDLAPVATAASALSGPWAELMTICVVIAACAAFASTANAGILSASRYPLAMGRDRLVPGFFSRLSRFGTPDAAVIVTSLAIGVLVAFFDVMTIAKLASAFQLMLFGLVCLCVIVMRESGLSYYQPGFKSPFYPWMQIAGIILPIWLIAEMGWVATLFSAGLVVACIAWFKFYGSHRVERDGAIFHVFERLGRRRFAALDDELRTVLHEKGPHPDDAIDEIVRNAIVMDLAGEHSFEDVVETVSERISRRTEIPADELAEVIVQENQIGMMPVVGCTAFPHHQYIGLDVPVLAVARVPDGVMLHIDEERAHVSEPGPVFLFFFFLSPDGDAASHYRVVAHLAGKFGEAIDADRLCGRDQPLEELLEDPENPQPAE